MYPPREDSWLLVPYARVPPGTLVLEVGAGAGLVSLAAARNGARVVATDLNPHALRLLQSRARDEGLEVAVVRTDLAQGLGRFARVLFNPPYLPTSPAEQDPDRWHNLALDGGPDGCRVLARWVDDLRHHLSPRGEAFAVVSSRQRPSGLTRVRRRWESRGGRVEPLEVRDLEGERLEVWRFRPGSD